MGASEMMVVYPAIFTKEGNGYWVRFPDLEGCLTEGKNLKHAAAMAEEAMGGYVATLIDIKETVPAPSEISEIKLGKNEYVAIVSTNMRKFFKNNKAVKKTLSIPFWLNEIADREHINYSAVLQDALIRQLEI